MDGGKVVMQGKTIYLSGLSNNRTGYTLTIAGSVGTGQVGISFLEPIQGIPHSLLVPNEELPQSMFPDSQEERFLDENLREFYRKKGL